jgi:hypothetical protein
MMIGFGPNVKIAAMDLSPVSKSQLASTVFGNDKKPIMVIHTFVHFMRIKILSLFYHEWNVTCLFLSKLVSLKRSQVLSTRVSLVNKTSK